MNFYEQHGDHLLMIVAGTNSTRPGRGWEIDVVEPKPANAGSSHGEGMEVSWFGKNGGRTFLKRHFTQSVKYS